MDYDEISSLRKHSPDFTAEIEPLIDLVGEFPAGQDGLFALAFGQGRQQHGSLRSFVLSRRLRLGCSRHDGRKIAWPVAELLIQAYVLGTLWKREQACVLQVPSVENCHRGFEKPLRHATVPVFRQHGQGSEEPE